MKVVTIVALAIALGCFCLATDQPSTKINFTTKSDPMTDKTFFTLSVDAEHETKYGVPALVVRCAQPRIRKDGWGRKHYIPQVDVYVVTRTPLAQGPWAGNELHMHSLLVRFDQDKPRQEMWEDSTDYAGVFLHTFTDKGKLEFVQRIAHAKRMVFGYQPYLGTPENAEFDISGAADYIGKMEQSCSWPK